MNYLEWSKILINHFFNETHKNQEVVLYTDESLFNHFNGNNCGEKDFLNIFDPKFILSNCHPRPNNRLANNNTTTLFNEFISLEHLLKYLVDHPNSEFKICNQTLRSSNVLSYFPFIILVIYAYSKEDGIFNQPEEQIRLGNEQNFRKYTFDLLLRLKNSLKNKYSINVHNIYGNRKGPHRFTGVFLYHSLFSLKHIVAIKEVVRRQQLRRPIYDDNEILIRFEKIERIKTETLTPAKLIINKIIEGSLYAGEIETSEVKIQRGNLSEIVLFPQIQLSDNNEINQYSLRVKFQTNLTSPESIFLQINCKEIETKSHAAGWYRSIKLDKFENTSITNCGINIYSLLNSEAMFFQQLGEVFDEFTTDSNFFIYTEKPKASKKTIFIGSEENRKIVKSFFKNLDILELENHIVLSSIPYDFIFSNGKINKINSISKILKLEFFGGYSIKNTGHDKIYPYFLMPKLNFDLEDDVYLRIKYQTKNNDVKVDKINNNDNIIFQNINTEYGQFAIDINKYLEFKNIDGRNLFSIGAELVGDNSEVLKEIKLIVINEFKQPEINAGFENPIHTIKIGEVPNSRVIDTYTLKSVCNEDYLTRIIATAVYADNVELSSSNLVDIITQTRYYKKLFLKDEENITGSQIIKNLRALGYIKVKSKNNDNNGTIDEYNFQPSELALVQTEYNPQFYNKTFFLSGLRSLEFVEGLCEILNPLIENSSVQIRVKNIDSTLSTILPPEIYISFKFEKNLNDFLSSEINITGIKICLRSMIKIIPYDGNALKDLTPIDVYNLNGQVSDIILSDLVSSVENDYKTILESNNNKDSYSLIKAKNNNSYFIGKGPNKGNYKLINTNIGFVVTYASNKIPYVFSEHLGNRAVGVTKPIYINSMVSLPQDIYSKLVYLNGGLPSIYKIKVNAEAELSFFNNPNTFEEFEPGFLLNEEVDYYKFDIDLHQGKELEKILSTKIVYIQNAQFIHK